MNTFINVLNEASKKFDPYKLKDYLIRTEEGDVIVDRVHLLQNKEDERLFYVILNKDYRWDYRYPQTTTIYFEEKDGKIFGGVYEISCGRRSNRIIAVPRELANEYNYNLYSYDKEKLTDIIDSIERS